VGVGKKHGTAESATMRGRESWANCAGREVAGRRAGPEGWVKQAAAYILEADVRLAGWDVTTKLALKPGFGVTHGYGSGRQRREGCVAAAAPL